MKRSGLNLFLLPLILFSLSAGALPWAPPSLGSSIVGKRTGSCTSSDGTKLTFSLEEHFQSHSVKIRNFDLEFDDAQNENSFSASRGKFYQGGDQLAPMAYAKDYSGSYVLASKGQLSLSLRMSKSGPSAQLSLNKGNTGIYRNKAMSCRVKASYDNNR